MDNAKDNINIENDANPKQKMAVHGYGSDRVSRPNSTVMKASRGRSGILNPLREKCHRIVVNNAGICSSFYFEDKYQWQPPRRI